MKNITLSILLIFIGINVHAQNNISGKVTDKSNHEPLEHVSIYFPDLEKGSVSDENGEFFIGNLPLGTYKLVASYIGYQSYSATIDILKGDNHIGLELLPTAIEMEEVIVSTPFHKLQRDNVMKVEYAKIADLRTKGAVTLAEGITHIPGVSMISTGTGIGKPVIRGLTSNRVLVYTQGIRLENQQFGDEHGLGVNDAGIEGVEVIKGPASLLYGSDAMGGVLYLNPEKFATSNTIEGDLDLNYNSNTQGINSSLGIRSSGSKFRFLARAGTSDHIDYMGGDGKRVTNSRYNEKDLKLGAGYLNTFIKSEIRYNYNRSLLGIPESIGVQTTSRTPESPYQKINSHILSSNTKIFLKNSSLDVTLGYIGNDRKEFEEHHHEGPGDHEEEGEPTEAALDMRLDTYSYNILYQLPKWEKLETIIGIQGIYQDNTNYGHEILIPDALTRDIGVLGTTHFHLNQDHDFQFGLRYDYRKITGEAYGTPGEEGSIAGLDRNFSSFNGALGYKNNISEQLIGRINLATGFRAPNLAELTSYGGHAGTNRFEIGNADLKNEQNIQIDLALEFKNEHLEFFLNGFHNSIGNYIFIAPNGTFINENAVYDYLQQDAELYGGEIGFHLHPHPYDWLHWESSYQTVIGKLDDGNPLPLIPANNLTNTIRVEFYNNDKWWSKTNAFVTLNTTFRQGRISEFETTTPQYTLLDAGLGGELRFLKKTMNINIVANNLLDKNYMAHLSRLKPDKILNMGRSVSLGVFIPL